MGAILFLLCAILFWLLKDADADDKVPLWKLACFLYKNKRIRAYTGKKLPQVGHCVFEYDPKSDLKTGENPGFGPSAGVITSLDNCDVGVRWFDTEKEEAMHLGELRQAPKPGEVVKTFYPPGDGKVVKYVKHSVIMQNLAGPKRDLGDGHVLSRWIKCR